jgi:23S rRNA (uridine2552-2'-O)-methyltransferase
VGKKHKPSSKRWLAEHAADHYVHEARRLGYRSRAVFKLKELSERDRLLKAGITVVDLGAAPGSWAQFARPLLGPSGKLIALDILPMDPVPEVDFIEGDFREETVLRALESKLQGSRSVDLVMSDMSPNITGVDTADQVASIHLAELALDFARAQLKPSGAFVTKLFQGEGFEAFVKTVRKLFDSVQLRKPKASRPRSREIYLVARNFRVV